MIHQDGSIQLGGTSGLILRITRQNMIHQDGSIQGDEQDEQSDSDEIIHFPLEGLLPAGHTFALNKPLCTLLHLAIARSKPEYSPNNNSPPPRCSSCSPSWSNTRSLSLRGATGEF